jgi:hypothetical protein
MNEQEQLFHELREDLKRDNLKKLWQKHGHLLIVASIAIVVGTGIGVAWKDYRLSQNRALTAQLMQALKVQGRAPQAAALEEVAKAAGSHPQAALAHLAIAAKALEADDKKTAAAQYQAITGEEGLRNLGRVMATHMAADGIDLPAGANPTPDEAFYDAWREAEAWRLYSKGEKKEAQVHFATLAGDANVVGSERERSREVAAFLSNN